MKKTLFSLIFLSLLLLLKCVDNKFTNPPIGVLNNNKDCFEEVNFEANTSINQLKTLLTGSNPIEITSDLIISGRVISSDETGNFYKELIIQSDNGGIAINIDRTDLNNDYKLGQAIYAKCKGLWLGANGKQVELGKRVTTQGYLGRIPNVDVPLHIYRKGCPENVTPTSLSITDVSDDNLYRFVTFNNVQFSQFDVGGTYALPSGVSGGPASVNRTLEDCEGNGIILRNSGYATFAADIIPEGSGKVSGVLTKYNSDYQLIVNSTDDIALTNARCGETAPTTATHTISALKAMYSGSTYLQITSDITIEGVITANDENGNFYKEIFIQNGTTGIRVNINKTNLKSILPVGTKVFIKTKDLFLDDKNGEIELGSTYESSGATNFGGIDESDLSKHIFVVSSGNSITPEVLKIDELGNSKIATLIKIDSVQFRSDELSETYGKSSGSKNVTLEDCNGNTLVLRTSSYADFADQKVAQGNGSITGILGVYNGTYQLLIRDIDEVALNNTRCVAGSGSSGCILEQDFEAVTANVDIALAKWTNYATAGTIKWQGKSFSGNKYAQFSAYNTNEASSVGWLISPALDLDAQTGEKLTFKTKDGYNNGATLAVLISTDYSGSGDPSSATWTTLSATIASGTTSGYASGFTASGNVDISGYTGTAYIAFRYTGGDPGQTTTYQLDEVKVCY